MSYQSRNHDDPSTYDDWHDLASKMTMLPVDDPRDQPVVRKHVIPKRDRPRFKSKREGDTYIGPQRLFEIRLPEVFGNDFVVGEKTKSWPFVYDLPPSVGASDKISIVAISSLSNGGVVSLGFRELEGDTKDVLDAVKTLEQQRLRRDGKDSYQPEFAAGDQSGKAYLQYVFPNQEFYEIDFPYDYRVLGDDLKTVGVSRFYVVHDHLIQVAAILPLPEGGMTREEAKEYGLAEMERIMDAITFPPVIDYHRCPESRSSNVGEFR